MWRFAKKLKRRSRLLLAWAVTLLALTSLGFAIAEAHTWVHCRSFTVRSYPKAYPDCAASPQSHRPVILAGAGALFLVLGVGTIYLWTDDGTRAAARRRQSAARRTAKAKGIRGAPAGRRR
jgi:hypothetical protein